MHGPKNKEQPKCHLPPNTTYFHKRINETILETNKLSEAAYIYNSQSTLQLLSISVVYIFSTSKNNHTSKFVSGCASKKNHHQLLARVISKKRS